MSCGPAGMRRYQASVEQHDGTLANGRPTYEVDADWDVLLSRIPVSYRDTTGLELIRGVQVEADATGIVGMLSTPTTRTTLKPKQRIRINDRKLNIINVLDIDGRERALVITVKELK